MRRSIFIVACLLSFILSGCSQGPEEEGILSVKKDAASIHKSKESPVISSADTAVYEEKEIIKDNITAIVPTSIEIPVIGVKAPIEQVGTLKNGQMGVPKDFNAVGWYMDGVMPGDRGSAVLAGHVDSKTGPAVFYKLEDLEKGDKVIISERDGQKLTFEVKSKKAYPRNHAPVDEVFGFTYRKAMNLITCTGDFNRDAGTHEERLVIYTEMIE